MHHNEISHTRDAFFCFAGEHIACRHDLHALTDFPSDIWKAMANAGLFRTGIAKDYGGTGDGYLALAAAGEALVRGGRNMGLALSWLYQQLVARCLMMGFGSDTQRKQYLEAMAQGRLTASFAVSEPKHGPHPKLLSTKATKDGEGYVIRGEKTYLTNGPIADLYLVVAVTEEGPPRRRFTAFLVPRATKGLALAPPMNLPFLKPAAHGGIVLSNCSIPATAILGERHSAYEAMVIPFAEIEDTVMMGLAVGALSGQLDMLTDAIRRQGREVEETLHGELGTAAAALEALRTIAYAAAGRLDRGEAPAALLTISFHDLATVFRSRLGEIQGRCESTPHPAYQHLDTDLSAVSAIRKRGLDRKREKAGISLLKEAP